jgi:Secretion system C-terminal sorting domain/Bacterial Ig domain
MHIKHTTSRFVFTLLFISLFSLNSLFSQVYTTNFDTDPQGWTFSPQQYGLAWKWYNNVGVDNLGGIRTKETPTTTTFFAASPSVQLNAGARYSVRFKAKCVTSNARTITIATNNTATRLGSNPIYTSNNIPTSFSEFSTTFIANGALPTYFIIYGNKLDASGSYTFLHLDDFKVELVPNLPPSVALSTNNVTVTRGANISLYANALDTDGSIVSVEFFRNSVKIGEDFTAPYLLTTFCDAIGTAKFTATAKDNLNGLGFSNELPVAITNAKPTISLSLLNSNSTNFTQGNAILLKTNASDADGTVSKVSFYSGTTLIGQKSSAPFEFSWTDASIGLHNVTAVVTDNDNATTTSNQLALTINASNNNVGSNNVATWNFNTGAQGWTLPTTYAHAFQWYVNQGVDGLGGMRLKLPTNTQFIASPSVNLEAGTTYTASFVSKIGQSSGTRIIHVAYCSTPTRIGATDIASVTLPGASYTNPTFTRYSPTFTVPTSGNYHLIFYVEEAGYLYTYLDDVILEKTILPTIAFTAPTAASFLEGQPVNIAVNAADVDGFVTKVDFFANGILIKTITTAPFSFNWVNMLPNAYILTAKVTDNRGNVALATPKNVQVNLATGNLQEFVDFSFNQTFEYWWRWQGDWRWKSTEGYQNSGYLYGFTVKENNFFASHGVQLQAGVTYKFQCRMDANNPNKAVKFSVNNAPTLGGQLITNVNPLVTEDFLQVREVDFTVATTGLYYLIVSHPWVSGSYQQLKIDNLRIIGDMNKAPVSKITLPLTSSVKVAENANLKMRAEATDFDGSIAKVEYFANGTKVGEATTAPYEIIWPNLTVGNYKVVCKATDLEGLADTSKTLYVTVFANKYSIATLLGGSSNSDEVRASVIQTDGTIVLAANISDASLPNVTPTLLNNTTSTTSGSIIRLTADGKTVLSVTKLATQITDMSVDSLDNLYIAAGSAGAFKLNKTATQIVWQQSLPKFAHRIDAGKAGKSIVLSATEIDADDETLTGAAVNIYDVDGSSLAQLGATSQYTTDVAIDEASGTAISIGFKNFNTSDGVGGQSLPVYVPVIRGFSFDGVQKYVAYDWSSDVNSPRWLNRSANNMADVRAVRCTMGKDGKLYVMHEVYGGNHCLRYSPFDILQTVPIVAGDMYFNFANTGTRVKVFVGRHEAGTGAYIAGQQFTARINAPLNIDNTVFVRRGAIEADAEGRVFITGQSASGIPLSIDHQPGEYSGGAFLLILSPNLATRESCERLTNGNGRALAVASKDHYVFGGSTSNSMYAANPFQFSLNGTTDGWFAVYNETTAPKPATKERDFVSLDENNTIKMGVYPNPSESGQLNVTLQGLEDKNFKLQVVNLSGQIVYTTKGTGDADLQLSDWQATAGTYFVRLMTNDGIMTEKVVIF